jgi:hypothetical protein
MNYFLPVRMEATTGPRSAVTNALACVLSQQKYAIPWSSCCKPRPIRAQTEPDPADRDRVKVPVDTPVALLPFAENHFRCT